MTSPVRALWDAPPPTPGPPRRVWRDVVLVVMIPLLSFAEAALRPEVPWRWGWAVVLTALAPTLLWRRTRPFAMLAVVFVVGTAIGLALGDDPQLYTTAYFLILVYAVFRWGSGRAVLGGSALVLAGTLLTFLGQRPVVSDVIGGIAVAVTTASLGLALRWRTGARVREIDRARLRERERFARDLHDTVAHHVSAIAIQAQAGILLAPGDPAAAVTTLRLIEGEAGRTLDELRSMVRVLRATDPPELAPTPGIDDVRRLAAPSAAAGSAEPRLEVRVTVDGDADALPAAVAAAVFRLAQEAVTNARRHARGATTVEVRLRVDAAGARLDVRDDGRAAASSSPGFGLTGMAERASLLGGTCEAGPAPGGGWVVSAVLPRAGWAT